MKYVIVRPGGLKNDPASGAGVLTEDNSVCGAIRRDDVAELIVQCLFSSKTSNLVTILPPLHTPFNQGLIVQVLSAVDKDMLFLTPKFDVFRP